MAAKRKPYKTYTKEFKIEAVRLADSEDHTASEVAKKLGIRRNQIYKWKEQLADKGGNAFAGRGRPKKADQSETSLLRQEVERLKEENDILKKAAVFFARALK